MGEVVLLTLAQDWPWVNKTTDKKKQKIVASVAFTDLYKEQTPEVMQKRDTLISWSLSWQLN